MLGTVNQTRNRLGRILIDHCFEDSYFSIYRRISKVKSGSLLMSTAIDSMSACGKRHHGYHFLTIFGAERSPSEGKKLVDTHGT